MRIIAGMLILWILCAFILLGVNMLGFVFEIDWRKITGLWVLITCLWFIISVMRPNHD